MGREIRRVPPNWQHPVNWKGHLQPMHDRDFNLAARDWLDDAIAWDNGTHPAIIKERELREQYPFFWQWETCCPDPRYYRPAWQVEEATAYQVYENVTEGTPVSPVLLTEDLLFKWLTENNWDPDAARWFIETKWAPSGIIRLPDNPNKPGEFWPTEAAAQKLAQES